MKVRNLMIILCLVLLPVSLAFADNNFVGASKCKACHKKAKAGKQYVLWSKNKHAQAFKSLASEKAVALAKKVGVNSPPQQAKDCLICHLKSKYDANGMERSAKSFGKKYKHTDGIQCEDCHGPGQKYVKKKIMKKITYKEGGAAKSATAKKTGLWFPDEKSCKTCHRSEIKIGGMVYKNPTFKDFDFAKRLKEIEHPIPKK